MRTVNEVVCIVSSEDHLQNNLKENMDQIRKTMMQHEALFKEQVHALHKLYNIQKLEMEEIKKRIYSPVKALAFNSESVVVEDDQFRGSVLEGKPLRPAYVTAQAYKESVSLSLRPFCAFKEFKSCGSLRIDGRGVETFCAAQSKPVRNFDLEKLPEDYIDESEIQVEPNSSATDARSILSKTTPNTDKYAYVGATQSVIGVDSPSLQQMNQETDLKILLVPSKETFQDCDRASECKLHSIDINKCATGFPNNTTENNISPDFPHKYLPAVGNSPAYEDSRPSTNKHIVKPELLHQGSLVFTTQRLDPIKSKELQNEKIPEQAEESNVPCSAGLYQYLESVAACHMKLEGELSGHIGQDCFPKNPAICSQGSSTIESLHCEPKNHNSFFVQRSLSCETDSISGKQYPHSFTLASQSTEGGNEDQNDSGDGSNSIHSQDIKTCKNRNIDINRKDTPELSDNCHGPGHTSLGRVEVVQFELEEVTQYVKPGFKPSLSSTLLDSEIKHKDHSDCSNGEPRTVPSSEEPVVVKESNEGLKDKTAVDKAHESIAAEILLSFVPGISRADSGSYGTKIEAELGKSSGDNISSDKKWNLRERKYTNYSNAGGNESIKWTKSVCRRRTSRRTR